MKSLSRHVLFFTSAVALGACAHAVPGELSNARAAFQRAKEGPAARLVPAELHVAEVALAKADRSFNNEDDAFITRDLSYVAQRKAEMADALASIAESQTSTAKAKDAFSDRQGEIVEETKQDLVDTRVDLSQTRTALMAALAKLAAVKEEDRGLVITLSGSVLFRSGEATLLPEAQTRLDQVAEALLTSRERALVVEGHTDSQGGTSNNLDLSQRRADAVRVYLVGRGYPSTMISSQGLGETRPVASNGDPEGRSNNRRVEIIITPAGGAQTGRAGN
jgi:outer membrane protein OmpA-like peptidoglycan-associated protein